MISSLLSFFAAAGSSCDPGNAFFGFPTWYEYIGETDPTSGACMPAIHGINDIWLIVAAIIEILLRIAALAAVIIIIYGGVQYITSQDNPESTSKARGTIINALLGLALSVMAAAIISFIANNIS
jgi:hypothetical protein